MFCCFVLQHYDAFDGSFLAFFTKAIGDGDGDGEDDFEELEMWAPPGEVPDGWVTPLPQPIGGPAAKVTAGAGVGEGGFPWCVAELAKARSFKARCSTQLPMSEAQFWACHGAYSSAERIGRRASNIARSTSPAHSE